MVWSGRDPVAEQSWEVAAYDNAPYDVVVQAVDDEGRAEGVKSVGARAPEEIGLAFEEARSTVVPLPVPPGDPEPQCWNGAPVPEGKACPLPVGLEGLSTVFPAMDETCEERPSQLKNKLEVFECTYPSYTLKYSRWKESYDRFDYFDRKNAEHLEPDQGDWRLDGKVVGEVWTSIDTRPDQERTFRWQATYDDWPYEVLVQGVDEAGREEGMAAVRARLPQEIGLR